MRRRVYVDTSVIGGCLDEQFAEESKALLEMARRGEIRLLVSDVVIQELEQAPAEVRHVLAGLPVEAVEYLSRSEESKALRDAYEKAGVVGRDGSLDAHHVALATIARADLIVSWNFKHIVHVEKIRGYNSVNLWEGYPAIDIRSPREVV